MAILLDTGPLVALLNQRDAHHGWSVEKARKLAPPLYTCEAVIAEAHFLLQGTKQGRRRLIDLLDSGKIELTSVVAADLGWVGELMNTYSKVPMAFADACLVCMNEHIGGKIFTQDKVFRIYSKNQKDAIELIIP